MEKRFVFTVVYLIAALISGSVAAYGQQSYAALLGQISDQNGAGVAGAKITVTSKETGLARAVTTDSSGSYRVGLLAAGEYSIKVEASGFGASEQADLLLRVGDERRVDVALRPGQVSASVTIEAPITDSATSTLSAVVPAERVNALPLISSTWALPFGRNQRFLKDPSPVVSALVSDWQINGILAYQSGQPFTVTVGAFDAGTGISNRRPNQTSDPHENVPAGFAFNPAAFVAPPAGQFGSVGRNTLRADNYFNTDFAALRNFRFTPLGEVGAVEFRAEFFNLFNNPSFTLPVSSLSNAAFSRYVSNSTAPRVIQFVAKVKF